MRPPRRSPHPRAGARRHLMPQHTVCSALRRAGTRSAASTSRATTPAPPAASMRRAPTHTTSPLGHRPADPSRHPSQSVGLAAHSRRAARGADGGTRRVGVEPAGLLRLARARPLIPCALRCAAGCSGRQANCAAGRTGADWCGLPPADCRAARVYVSNGDAREHGIKASAVCKPGAELKPCANNPPPPPPQSVGLPSYLGQFKEEEATSGQSAAGPPGRGWWRHKRAPVAPAAAAGPPPPGGSGPLRELSGGVPVCAVGLPAPAPAAGWAGPRISINLPSFRRG